MTEPLTDTSTSSTLQQQQPASASSTSRSHGVRKEDAPGHCSSSDNSSKGINIHDALEILAERSASSSLQEQRVPISNNSHAKDAAGCSCCHGTAAPPNAASMGQTIDLFSAKESDKKKTDELKQEQAQALLVEQRAARQSQLTDKLQTMSVLELLQTVLQAQEQRVLTYRNYDRGLQQVLQTGNLTHYPAACATATASFSVISDIIRSVVAVLKSKTNKNTKQQQQSSASLVAKTIEQLQAKEKTKLNLTAALHLEQIRHANHLPLSTMDTDDETAATTSASNGKIAALMQRDVQSLQRQIADCVSEINELLQELRCSLLDHEEDEEE